MKIGIIGTRGIPNNYGGFEQFAQFLSEKLVMNGLDVSVYCPHSHPYKKDEWKGVKLIRKFDPENKIGTIGQFVYDLDCINDCRKRDFDIILQLGYTSSSIWSFRFPKKSFIVTNMDGLEWKRSKYPKPVKLFLKYAEKLGALKGGYLVADSTEIKKHIFKTYRKESTYIPYGANLIGTFEKAFIEELELRMFEYELLIARLEPENNIEMILNGFSRSNTNRKFVVVGNLNKKLGKNLIFKYKDERILFLGGIYNQEKLNALRYFSNLYFHGHSVGGTNPSLLEAMATRCLICAHDNIFNRDVLKNNGYYFKTEDQIIRIINETQVHDKNLDKINNNLKEVEEKYSWEIVSKEYIKLFKRVMDQH